MFIVTHPNRFVLVGAKGKPITQAPTMRELVLWLIRHCRNVTIPVNCGGYCGVEAFFAEAKTYGRGVTLVARQ